MLNQLDGVSAKVNLKRKTAVVSMEKEVEDEEIKKAIENAILWLKGYDVKKSELQVHLQPELWH